ncbi:hypothetical protein VNO77_10359 [Canavalia gladiata]|uniref:Uncharacterized protein n=1 Tax=Canavalia gladiata TaxID=3824 RepID=A0AAN9R208_CANGL
MKSESEIKKEGGDILMPPYARWEKNRANGGPPRSCTAASYGPSEATKTDDEIEPSQRQLEGEKKHFSYLSLFT